MRWTITGVAGFIGSNLLEKLLSLGQHIVGLDDLSTGHRHNIEDVLTRVPDGRARFRFIEGDIRDSETCRDACAGADVVLHQAALGSVPRSIRDPATSLQVNVNGFLQVLLGARDSGVKRVVYASSSSVYGDADVLPQVEDRTGRPLSPYAATKVANETFAVAFERTYGVETTGLRYFNVFGPRQDPEGPYAAVIPRWVDALLKGEPCRVFGDGETSRDFCYVSNVVQANLLAALAPRSGEPAPVYNIACGESTSLTTLFRLIRDRLAESHSAAIAKAEPIHEPFRSGDIRRSLASIDKVKRELGYAPEDQVAEGLDQALRWFVEHCA